MERKTYLGRYQVSLDERGEPIALDRGASSVTLRAEDKVSGEPLVIEVVRPGPLERLPLDEVEADARAAQQLDHINIAKLRDFGFDGTDIVYVREFLEGSTLDMWVVEHGPLPVAAVMRIALQGVNALAASAFQGVTHRAIQPANVMIVPGQTPEGDWPLIKILNFGAVAPVFSRSGFTTSGPGDLVQFASPEQLQGAKPDFKSDIYSLGATLWYLLTGAAPRAGMLERSRGIPKNVAAVVSRMLAANPEHRPVDPLVLQEDIRECLGRAERRDAIGRRFGLPAKVAKPSVLAAAVAPPPLSVAAVADEAEEAEPVVDAPAAAGPAAVGNFLLRPLAWAAALLALGLIGAMTLPGAVRAVKNWQAQREPEQIGVKVGVPEPAADAVASTAVAPAPAANAPADAAAAPDVAPSQDTAAVAENRTAPAPAASPSFPSAGSAEPAMQSAPAVAAAPTTTLPDNPPASSGNTAAADAQTTAPAMAYMNNNGAASSRQTAPSTQTGEQTQAATAQQQSSGTAAARQAPVVAANTTTPPAQGTEPAAPAEGPDNSGAQAQNSSRESRSASQPKTASASAEGERKAARSASRSNSRTKTTARTGLTAEEQTELEVRQALPLTPEEERALPPIPRGSKRARYLGTTPDGALVFGMPSNEQVYVAPPENSPRRRLRRLLTGAEEPPVRRAEPVDPEELAELEGVEEDEE
jgi:hypothetical protein